MNNECKQTEEKEVVVFPANQKGICSYNSGSDVKVSTMIAGIRG